MNVIEWYFCFHRPHVESLWGFLGHVEVFGYTRDDTWIFFDPARVRSKLIAVHKHDEVEELMAMRFREKTEVLRTSFSRERTFPPIFLPMNCVSQCASLIGVRALTPWGLRRRLLQNGAEVIHGRRRRRVEGR